MSIVALISDLGTKDHYVSLVKAALLNNNPTIIPVDISHEVGTGEIGEAAFLFRSVWNSFPFGTVFMNGISSYKNSSKEHIIIEYQDRYLITADNGVFSLIFPDVNVDDVKIYLLNIEAADDKRFPMSGVFALAAARIAQGNYPELWCEKLEGLIKIKGLEPYLNGQDIVTQVMYIDHFGNLYFNLTKKLFDEIGKGRSFAIPVRSQTTINKFHERFVDVEVGNEVAFWGQNDYLVISMNREGGGDRAGTFNRLMNLDLGDSLTISFHGDANR
jgi:S-adenosylmethionine hydrolase